MAKQGQWVRVLGVPGTAEAEMWRGLLEGQGIVTLLRPSDLSPYLGANSFCDVLVPTQEAERAAELITAWSTDPGPDDTNTPEA